MPEVEELTEGDPETAVLENARRKAQAVVERVGVREVVMAADTEVVLDGRVLGKATTRDEAEERLRLLSGRTHEVLTGLVLIGPPDVGERSGVARSRVTFRELDTGFLELYVGSGEWRDRAGAYTVQGPASRSVRSREGDLSKVIGLPVNLLLELAPELRDKAGGSLSDAGLQPDSKV